VSVSSAFTAAGVRAAIAAAEAPRAEKAMLERHIATQDRARMFLAQVLHESGGLNFFEEIASGAKYEGRRDLGNTQPGDGRRYKGRGPIQLTGRANYRSFGQALGLPLEDRPELAARHDIGWRIAALYWQSRGLNELADQGQFVRITKRINGGTNGLEERVRYLGIVSRDDCRPRPPDALAHLTDRERAWCREYDRLRQADRDPDRRRVLRRVMTEQRKRIWRAAQQTGWNRANRAARYRSLWARTT
jgi:predicted chitinase